MRVLLERTLDLGLDIVNGVRRFHLKGDRLTRKGLDEDLHRDEGLVMDGLALVFCWRVVFVRHLSLLQITPLKP